MCCLAPRGRYIWRDKAKGISSLASVQCGSGSTQSKSVGRSFMKEYQAKRGQES